MGPSPWWLCRIYLLLVVWGVKESSILRTGVWRQCSVKGNRGLFICSGGSYCLSMVEMILACDWWCGDCRQIQHSTAQHSWNWSLDILLAYFSYFNGKQQQTNTPFLLGHLVTVNQWHCSNMGFVVLVSGVVSCSVFRPPELQYAYCLLSYSNLSVCVHGPKSFPAVKNFTAKLQATCSQKALLKIIIYRKRALRPPPKLSEFHINY